MIKIDSETGLMCYSRKNIVSDTDIVVDQGETPIGHLFEDFVCEKIERHIVSLAFNVSYFAAGSIYFYRPLNKSWPQNAFASEFDGTSIDLSDVILQHIQIAIAEFVEKMHTNQHNLGHLLQRVRGKLEYKHDLTMKTFDTTVKFPREEATSMFAFCFNAADVRQVKKYCLQSNNFTHIFIDFASSVNNFMSDLEALKKCASLKSLFLFNCRNVTVSNLDFLLKEMLLESLTMGAFSNLGDLINNFFPAFKNTNTLQTIVIRSELQPSPLPDEIEKLRQYFEPNLSLINIQMYEKQIFPDICLRNLKLQPRCIWANLLDLTLNLPLLFPPYLVLEIFDWYESHHLVHHYTKISLIIRIQNSIRQVLENRELKNKELKIN